MPQQTSGLIFLDRNQNNSIGPNNYKVTKDSAAIARAPLPHLLDIEVVLHGDKEDSAAIARAPTLLPLEHSGGPAR